MVRRPAFSNGYATSARQPTRINTVRHTPIETFSNTGLISAVSHPDRIADTHHRPVDALAVAKAQKHAVTAIYVIASAVSALYITTACEVPRVKCFRSKTPKRVNIA